ncbi:MAG: hypothetical protein U0414_43320 [Polyangiaceae bacterium]
MGGWAVGVHSEPRYTKDLDLLIGTSPENLERVVRALEAYGAPPGLIQDIRTMKPHEFVFFGTPPARVERIGHSTCAFPFRDGQQRGNVEPEPRGRSAERGLERAPRGAGTWRSVTNTAARLS